MKLIGYLNKKFGYNYYQEANIGHKVYETDNRYCFVLKKRHDANKYYPEKITVSFYKEDLKKCIDFKIKFIDKIKIRLKDLYNKFK